jgi:multidrug efflux pump subunit AcrA (membrane-fusion protein)
MNDMNPKMIKIFSLFSILALIISLSACSSKKQNIEKEITGVTVKITHPQKMDLTEYITLNANTVFLKKEIVRATFQGFIEKIYKSIGDKIKSGDLLLEIKTKESAADNNLQVPLGDETFSGIIKIRAKSDGVLTELNYNAGDFVSDGEQIAVIANPSSLRINLNVPYQFTDKININTPCEIILPNGKIARASIQKIIPKIDLTAQTQTYILDIQQFGNLPENLNVNARIPIRTIKNATVLPVSSILSNETLDKFWIMKLLNDTLAVKVYVSKGIENDKYVQITKPELSLSDRIIVEGAFGLPDTTKIIIGK